MDWGTKEKTEIKLVAPEREEAELTTITVEASRAQLDQLLSQYSAQQDLIRSISPTLASLQTGIGFGEAISPEQLQQYQRDQFTRAMEMGQVQRDLLGLEMERLRSGVATPEQAAEIQRQADLAIEMGQQDIGTMAQQQMGLLRKELAPQLGLRTTDTPILDRGQEVARAAVEAGGQLARNVRAEQARQMIQAPLQMGALSQGLLGLTSVGDELQQRAVQNRLALLSGIGGLGFQGTGLPGLTSALSVLQQPRLAQKDITSSGNYWDLTAKMMGGAGGMMQGIGAMKAACWVAAEYFGWFTPDWWDARSWVMEGWKGPIGSLFRAAYLRYGERVAAIVRRRRLFKAALRPIFLWILKRGREYRNASK